VVPELLDDEPNMASQATFAPYDPHIGTDILFSQHPQASWVFDLISGRVLCSNGAAQRSYGYTADEFCELSFEALWPESVLTELEELRANMLVEAEQVSAPGLLLDSGGVERQIACSWHPVSSGGRPAVMVVLTDVPDERPSTESLPQADLLDLASDAIIVCDFSCGIIFWNQGAARLYGYSRQEVLGRSMVDLLMKDLALAACPEEAVRTAGEWKGELEQIAKDGRKLIVNSRWTLVRSEAGRPEAILVINTDLTETKNLETQFLRAQRLESIGTLASGIAHDLNNILSPILMSVGLLRRGMDPPDQERVLSMIESSAERGAGIVKQVLTFARGVEGERVLLQPKHLINEISKILTQTFPKNIDVQTQFPSDLWTVMGDATQVHQVLLNLCVNARDAMPKGGLLTITAENVEVDQHFGRMNPGAKLGDHVLMRVTDTGCGMSLAVIDKIFDPFFTTKGVGKGTGLGLATVMGIVKSHEGFLTVQSDVGVGTTFQIFIPATREDKGVPTDVNDQSSIRGMGELVLVVDDEAPIREALVQTLEDFGYRAFTAEDGTDALALYVQRKDEIDIVVTDLAMGLMDGFSLIRSLRKFDPTVHVIVSTGHCDTEQQTLLGSLGVRAILDKPYNATKLLRSLRDILRPAGGSQT
jgi:two-component system cell cycle sensor histidine kinase/response regulator CckA